MNLHFEYKLTNDDCFAFAKIICKDEYIRAVRQNMWKGIFWLLILGLGALASYISGILILLFLFIGAAVGHIYDIMRFKVRFWNEVFRNISVPRNLIILDVNEKGIREQSEGIESFAPWSTLTKVIDQEDRIFIQLASRQWYILPITGLITGSDLLEDLRSLLSQKQREAEQGAAANRYPLHC